MNDHFFNKDDSLFYLQTMEHITSLPIVLLDKDGNILLNLGGWRDKDLALSQDKILKEDIIKKAQAFSDASKNKTLLIEKKKRLLEKKEFIRQYIDRFSF